MQPEQKKLYDVIQKDMTKTSHRNAEWVGLFPDFKSTSYMKAFVLNGMASALITGMTIQLRILLTPVLEKAKVDEGVSLIITMAIAFGAAFLAYLLMWFLFGYGGGDLTHSGTVLTIQSLQKQLDKFQKNLNATAMAKQASITLKHQ